MSARRGLGPISLVMATSEIDDKWSLVMTSDLHVISLVIFMTRFHLSNASQPRRVSERKMPQENISRRGGGGVLITV